MTSYKKINRFFRRLAQPMSIPASAINEVLEGTKFLNITHVFLSELYSFKHQLPLRLDTRPLANVPQPYHNPTTIRLYSKQTYTPFTSSVSTLPQPYHHTAVQQTDIHPLQRELAANQTPHSGRAPPYSVATT